MSLNFNGLIIFQAVYRLGNMTLAAKELHLTQSGISQHIQNLEDSLGLILFERVGRRIFPTRVARELYEKTNRSLQDVEKAVAELKRGESSISGVVRIGLPIEFGNNIVIPLLSQLGRTYPDIQFNLTLEFATELSERVLSGDLDFALIDKYKVDRILKVETVASEHLLLCGSTDYVKKFGPVKYTTTYLSQFDYVDYKDNEPIIRSWFRHHLGRPNLKIRARAHIFDVQGVARFVSCGLGLGVLPDHVVDKMRSAGESLFVFTGTKSALKNEMALIHIPSKKMSTAQELVMNTLRTKLRG